MDRPSPAVIEAARAARSTAVWARRPEVRTLELIGPDRARYLNGQVTQDVLALGVGQGALAVKTSAKGRCEALIRVRARDGSLLLDLREVVSEPTRAALERYIIMDDCEVRDISPARAVLTVLGPARRDVLAAAGVEVPEALPAHAFVDAGGVTVIGDVTLGAPGYELQGPAGRLDELAARLTALGVVEASTEALDIVRVEQGVPVDGCELDAETIPLEAHLQHAISMSKGCYSGQEVIARATNLGGVNWSLVGLSFDAAHDAEADAGPAVRAELRAPGIDKPQGHLTSVVWSPLTEGWIALGFVRRAQEAPGTRLSTGERMATVAALPFRP